MPGSQLNKKLKQQDIFTKKIELQFDDKGSEHSTLAGGFVSFLIKIILFGYALRLSVKIIKKQDAKIETIYSKLENETEYVNYDDTHFTAMISLRNSSGYGAKPPVTYEYNEEIMKYISIFAYNKERNPNIKKHEFHKIEVTSCDEELSKDFGKWKK